MTLAQLRMFIAVVEAGGFTRAAEALGMTQSGVSHAIAGLEGELGLPLLTRDRDRVALSLVGERVLAHAREILCHVDQIRQDASGAACLEVGKLRVGSLYSVSTRLLPGISAAFQRRYPGIELVVFEGTDDEVREWVLSRAIDVGFVALPVEGVEVALVAEDEMLAVLPPAHPLHGETKVGVARFAADPFVMSKAGCETLIRSAFRAAGVTPRIQFEVRDVATVLAMAQEGLGVTVMPAMALPPDRRDFHALPLDPPVRRRLGLAARSFTAAPPAVLAFVEQARVWATAHGYSGEG